jgi:uracil-DNA glycosylase
VRKDSRKKLNWNEINNVEKQKPYFTNLNQFVNNEYQAGTCYPPYEKIFDAIKLTPYENVKCVILGQDPYHEPNQAMGLSFSVMPGVTIPRSLQNIYKELHDELGCYIPNNGDLTSWANQGVLLLNSVLSVRAHQAASHSGHGWETYTDALLTALNKKDEPIVFMLWGKFAKSKKSLITNPKHLILESTHPSPFSASYGFFGCGHFKSCNNFLVAHGKTPIDWQIKNI